MRIIVMLLFVINVFALELPEITEETLDIATPIEMEKPNLKIAVILDKQKLFKLLPNITNSINAYMSKKDITYSIKIFNKDKRFDKELANITQKYKYIFVYLLNPKDIKFLRKYPNNYFFIPTLSKGQVNINDENIFFGGIDYKSQVLKLNTLITSRTNIVYQKDSVLSKYITKVVNETLTVKHKIKQFPIHYSRWFYSRKYLYLNTDIIKTIQILSSFTYYRIRPKLELSTQLNYVPYIFTLTSDRDIKRIIIANSILNINPILEDDNLNLRVSINFNWFNYTTSTLLNLAYNLETKDDFHFLNDFGLYVYFNQVNYQTNLYRVFQNGFIKVQN